MQQFILVALGGAAGALARWKLSGVVLHHTLDWRFPMATFLVNVAGCLVAGILAGLVTKLEMFSPDARLFLFTGLLGGFTTFSAFGVETVALLRRGEMGVAAAYVLLSVTAGIVGVWLGMAVVRGGGR
jgi:CrcB protein